MNDVHELHLIAQPFLCSAWPQRSRGRWVFMLFGRQLLAQETIPVLLLQLHVVGHQPRRVVIEAFGNAMPHFADLINHWIVLFRLHRCLRLVPGASLARERKARAWCSPDEYGRTYSRWPNAGNSRLRGTRTCDKRPTPGA